MTARRPMLSHTSPSPSRWLWQPRLSSSPRLRLFCLPYAGGSASIYRSWYDLIPADVDLCPIQLPGRESRFSEAPVEDPETLLADLQDAITPWLDRPFVLLGYSMGGLIAHALACRLKAYGAGSLLQRLVLAACSSPEHPTSIDPQQMSREAFLDHVSALGGAPAAVFAHAELMELVLPMLRADFQLVARLRTQAPPRPERVTCPITALSALDDAHAPPDRVAHWAAHTHGETQHVQVPGDHFALWRQPQLLVAAALHADLG
jgi:medium-chain acyl-[acyl-carrier-protein] hydrolase